MFKTSFSLASAAPSTGHQLNLWSGGVILKHDQHPTTSTVGLC